MSRSPKPTGAMRPASVSASRTCRAQVDAGLTPISHESAIPLSMRDSGGPLALDASGHWTYSSFEQANAPARLTPPGAGNRRVSPDAQRG